MNKIPLETIFKAVFGDVVKEFESKSKINNIINVVVVSLAIFLLSFSFIIYHSLMKPIVYAAEWAIKPKNILDKEELNLKIKLAIYSPFILIAAIILISILIVIGILDIIAKLASYMFKYWNISLPLIISTTVALIMQYQFGINIFSFNDNQLFIENSYGIQIAMLSIFSLFGLIAISATVYEISKNVKAQNNAGADHSPLGDQSTTPPNERNHRGCQPNVGNVDDVD